LIGIKVGSRKRKWCRADDHDEEFPIEDQIVKSPCTSSQHENEHVDQECDTSFYVKIKWPSNERNFFINTPWRKESIKQLTRWNFRSFSTSVLSPPASLNNPDDSK
jgi:hypothetical protein